MRTFWKDKKVLVTGAAGFIGSHMVKALLYKEAVVTAVVSPKTDDNQLNSLFGQEIKKITIRKADLLNSNECEVLARGQDVILNFAAMDGGAEFKRQHSGEILSTNTRLTLNILEAAVKNNVERLLLMSSIEVYPKNTKSPIKEKSPTLEDNVGNTDGYILSKRFGEAIAKLFTKQYDLKIAIARMGNVYGPGDIKRIGVGRAIPTFISQIFLDKPVVLFNKGKSQLSLMYVDDAVDALLNLTELYAEGDPVNIVGETILTIEELVHVIEKLLQKKARIVYKEAIGVGNKRISIAKAKRILKFKENTSIESGLQHVIQELMEHV